MWMLTDKHSYLFTDFFGGHDVYIRTPRYAWSGLKHILDLYTS